MTIIFEEALGREMERSNNDKAPKSHVWPLSLIAATIYSWFMRRFIPTVKFTFYYLFTTERSNDSHRVRLFRFGIPIVMKTTPRTVSTEADALRFLNATCSGLPIPRLLDSFVIGETTYTIMTKLPGHNLLDRSLPSDQLEEVATEVLHFLHRLWQIEQPDNCKGQVMRSASGHGLPNPMTLHSNLSNTFPSTLHCYALMSFKDLNHFVADTAPSTLERLANDQVCWVHTDLRLQNILVQDGRLSGIVDWEDSGWLPRHWQLHMFRNVYMHGVTFEWWNLWKKERMRFDEAVEAVYELSTGLITYPL